MVAQAHVIPSVLFARYTRTIETIPDMVLSDRRLKECDVVEARSSSHRYLDAEKLTAAVVL